MPGGWSNPPRPEHKGLDQDPEWEVVARQLSEEVALLGEAVDSEEEWATVIAEIDGAFSTPQILDQFRHWLHDAHRQEVQTGVGSWPALARIVGWHADAELARDRRYRGALGRSAMGFGTSPEDAEIIRNHGSPEDQGS